MYDDVIAMLEAQVAQAIMNKYTTAYRIATQDAIKKVKKLKREAIKNENYNSCK